MHLKTINLKYTAKVCALGLCLAGFTTVNAQSQQLDSSSTAVNSNFQRYKVDGVAAVVGDYIILESDVKKMRLDIQNRMPEADDITNCQLLGRLMENKLFSHAAKQDSTIFQTITDGQIQAQVEQQISRLEQRLGSIEKVVAYYRKDSEQELREELFKIDKENRLAQAMQQNITEKVEITPEEVHTFFKDIPEDELPTFGDEVELAQLVIKPEIPQAEVDKVVQQLNDIRNDILKNGASFTTKAVLYSEDATSSNGGKMIINRDSPLDKDFKQVAFSLREGEVSKPFKSSFGYHIIQVDKIMGQERVIRHIIIIPKVTASALEAAREKTDSIRQLIVDGKLTFKQAVLKFSDDEETRGDGGRLINPDTGDSRFELTKIDPRIYNEVKSLKEGEVSSILTDQTRTGKKFLKLITVTGFYPEHVADYAKDYAKIKQLALRNKQFEEVQKWRQDAIDNTYIKVNDSYKDCDFEANWLKQ